MGKNYNSYSEHVGLCRCVFFICEGKLLFYVELESDELILCFTL